MKAEHKEMFDGFLDKKRNDYFLMMADFKSFCMHVHYMDIEVIRDFLITGTYDDLYIFSSDDLYDKISFIANSEDKSFIIIDYGIIDSEYIKYCRNSAIVDIYEEFKFQTSSSDINFIKIERDY